MREDDILPYGLRRYLVFYFYFACLLILRGVEDCTVQYDSIQVVQDDCIQFCDIIKARK